MGELVRLVIAETAEALETDVCSVYLARPRRRPARPDGDQRAVARGRRAACAWSSARASPARPPPSAGRSSCPTCATSRASAGSTEVDQARFVSMCSVRSSPATAWWACSTSRPTAPREFSDGRRRLPDGDRRPGGRGAGPRRAAGAPRAPGRRPRPLRGGPPPPQRARARRRRAAGGLRRDRPPDRRGRGGLRPRRRRPSRPAATGLPGAPARRRPGAAAWRSTPIRAGRETLGWLAVGPADRDPATSAAARSLEHGATVLALELVRERAADEARHRASGRPARRAALVGPRAPTTPSDLADRAAHLGHRLPGPAWVIAIEGDDAGVGARGGGRRPRRTARRDELRAWPRPAMPTRSWCERGGRHRPDRLRPGRRRRRRGLGRGGARAGAGPSAPGARSRAA